MKIGFDAKWYFDGPVSGRIVVRRLLDALARGRHGHEIVALTDRRNADQPLIGASAELERVHLWGSNNLVSNVLLLGHAASKVSCDVVIAQNFTPALTRLPSITLVYDLLFRDLPQFYSWRERAYFAPLSYLARRSTRVCTISMSERARMLRARVASETSIDVVPMGVDTDFAPAESHPQQYLDDVRERLALPARYLLFVGRLNTRKNLGNLLRAMPLLKDGTIPLVVAGAPDWKSDNPHALAASLGLVARVQFVGSVDQRDLPALFALATVFVFPSWAEGFGLPPLEAMKSGVPCAVSNVTSLPEVCGDAAEYFSPASPNAIAHAVDELLSNAALRTRLTANGIARAAEFTWEQSAAALVSSAESALAGSRE